MDYEKIKEWQQSDEYRRKLRSIVRIRGNARVASDDADEVVNKWMLKSDRTNEKAERLAVSLRCLLKDIREFSAEWGINLDDELKKPIVVDRPAANGKEH